MIVFGCSGLLQMMPTLQVLLEPQVAPEEPLLHPLQTPPATADYSRRKHKWRR